MKAKKESVATSGWNIYSGYVTVTPVDQLDLDQIEGGIDSAMNRVKYTMNGFVIAVGSYVKPLAKRAKATARKLGKVYVEMGGGPPARCRWPPRSSPRSKRREGPGRSARRSSTEPRRTPGPH